ncbi:OmpA family protein [Paragemmobacter straminiformis]|uniref:OmpA family protein n=1 Tax=Paragemmobacter straminiformis TaxID=2045119 RepID=A0A842IB00_9RHOB|nr:OmpA family protein [Gemmobacter straminiformis]MBC2837040.1 OmpA family protein [Gemmobacter straminiformis]
MSMKISLSLSAVALLGLTACTDPNYGPQSAGSVATNPNANRNAGAVIGGLLGAAAGANADNDSFAKAIVGGAIGAAVGGAIGNSLDQQAAELRGINGAFNVTNMGDYLVVNMPQDVLFAVDSATLRPDLTRDIKSIAGNLQRYPNSQIQIVGHTDNTGSAAYNQDLSQRRAVSVAQVLRESGVPNARITAFGRGEDQPIASNLTEQGRAQNRRVEIIIRPYK